MKKSPTQKKSKPLFREIEDAISSGALLRPTFVQAVEKLTSAEKRTLFTILDHAEELLSASQRPYRQRFQDVQSHLVNTYAFGPIWRFIAGRIEDTWRDIPAPGVKELSAVSVLLGILYEETENQLNTLGKKRSA